MGKHDFNASMSKLDVAEEKKNSQNLKLPNTEKRKETGKFQWDG